MNRPFVEAAACRSASSADTRSRPTSAYRARTLRFPRNSGHGLCGYSDLGQGYLVGDGTDIADRRVATLVIVEVDVGLDALS
jgi:hypothetical protein